MRFPIIGALVVGSGLALGGVTQAGSEPARLGLTPADALPTRPAAQNQKIADNIARHLVQSGSLRQYTIDITYSDRTAVLTGTVTDQAQREEVLRVVQGQPDVDRVVDQMTLSDAGLARVQAQAPKEGPPLGPPLPNPSPLPTLPPPQTEKPPEKGPELNGNLPTPEPTPIFQAPAPSPTELGQPRMPPYAWPTYAPYNNYSRVAYPLGYPYNAWPYIGPFYPFPKVPPGWRSVKLQWDDGHWWFSKHATRYDWWRLRYW
jgi:hypothetical protein